MTEEEIFEYLKEVGERREYWKIRPLPSLNALKNPEPRTKADQRVLDEYVEDLRVREYWINRAKRLLERPGSTKAELLTAMEGVSDPELLSQLKERVKKARN